MPSYRSITLSLRVATDGKDVAEYEPPTPTLYSSPQSNGDNSQPSHPPTTNHSNIHDPFTSPPVTLLDIPRSIVSVYTIIHDLSNFWLHYSIAPPYPPKALYYFKLFINGTEVASWGCGEKEGWRGSTMWGIFEGDNGRMERRSFCWTKQTDGGEGVMEVRVFRARGRMRVVPEVGKWKGLQRGGGKEIRCVRDDLLSRPRSNGEKERSEKREHVTKGSALPDKLPRRYYRYALLDSLDAPFATFRYYCRSWRQLKALGVEHLLIDSSPPTSRSSHSSDSENEEQECEDEHHQHDGCSPNLSTNTGSSGSSGASSGEELLTQFASSGLEPAIKVTKVEGTATDPSPTPSKGISKETIASTHLSSPRIRAIPPPPALVPKSFLSSVASPKTPPKNSPVSNHDSLTPPTVPAKHSRRSSPAIPPRCALFSPTAIPTRSALFSPKPYHDSPKSPTIPIKTPPCSSPTLPPRSALFLPKPHPGPPQRSPQRVCKTRSSREHFAAMIREGFPSPESARWKVDEERFGTAGNDSADGMPEAEERIEEEDGKMGRDSVENERRRGGNGSAEGKALKQGTLRMGMLKRVVESAVNRKREG